MGKIFRSSCRLGAVGTLLITVVSCGSSSGDRSTEPVEKVFTDVAEAAGLTHRHQKPVLDSRLEGIMPWMSSVGAAAAAGDYDGDGWIDLYVTSSRKGTPNFLYRNNGDGSFADVAAAAGVADANDDGGTSMDCIWADFDNDGRIDLYLVRWGTDRLFHNEGDGTFREVTEELFRRRDGAPGTQWANGNAAVALDYDLDGRIDLYVGNYFMEVDLWNLRNTRIMHDSFETARNAGKNYLYRQQPDGTFVEVAEGLGVDDAGWTMAAGSADVNNDGWPDLYVANDFGPDRLFLNDGRGGFTNSTEGSIGRDTKKGMNVDFGDFNNDGWMDIYVTNITTAQYLKEGNMLWRNNGPDSNGVVAFMDVSPETGTFNGGWGWGAKFFDYDNDGDQDLFAVNGFVSAGEGSYWYDLASWTVLDQDSADALNWPPIGDRSFSGYERFRFWRNDGFESFTRLDAEVGLESTRDGRGVVCFDYDKDGDVDLFVANQGQEPHLFRNDSSRDNHWIAVRLVANPTTGVNADAIGTRVTVVTDGRSQIRERDGGNGFAGQSDPTLHFGLGREDLIRLLEVRWPDGGLQYLEDVPADRALTIHQEPAEYVARSLVAVDVPERRVRTSDERERTLPELDPDQLNAVLTEVEAVLRANPSNHAAGYLYRKRCAEHSRHGRSIRFFQELVEHDPEDVWARIELSVAYVDKIPTCGGIAAIVCKGTLARRSLDQLDEVIENHTDLWEAFYARGMNHLHWPRALRHSADAVLDFSRSLEIQQAEQRASGRSKPYYERTYILLGDAQAKNRSYEKARRVWRDGLALFPQSNDLQERLAVQEDEALLAHVEARRSLEQPIDTNFSFLDTERSSPFPQ